MRIGMFTRAERRGIANQSYEFFRHVHPERTLVIDVANPDGFEMDLDRYPGCYVARLRNHLLPETLVREFLDGLDVLFTVETLYDWRVADWARDAGVATVVQCNPEFFQHHDPSWREAPPTVWWNPTTWRQANLPAAVRHVPVPVATDGAEPRQLPDESRQLSALHVIGRPALGDRNGTEIVQTAMRSTIGIDWTLRAQRPTPRAPDALGEVDDYWELYDGHDILVMPRRYGGLCLPAQEAMAAGLVVVMPSCPPNTDWPIVPVRWKYRGTLAVPTGTIPLAETDPSDLAAKLTMLAEDPVILEVFRKQAREWVEANSWEALLPRYEAEMELAVEELARSLTA